MLFRRRPAETRNMEEASRRVGEIPVIPQCEKQRAQYCYFGKTVVLYDEHRGSPVVLRAAECIWRDVVLWRLMEYWLRFVLLPHKPW